MRGRRTRIAVRGAVLLCLAASSAPAAVPLWSTRAPMLVKERGAAYATVNDTVYSIGGYNGGSYSTTTMSYDPQTNAWTARAPMPVGRFGPATAAWNGKIFLFGGEPDTNETRMYDPVADAWTLKSPGSVARKNQGAAMVNNKIYVIGGISTGTLNEEYDPVLDTWATRTPMTVPRQGMAVAAYEGKIYVIGGGSGYGSGLTGAVEVYDPILDSWTSRTPMPTPRDGVVGIAAGGKIYVIGGRTGVASTALVEIYDPATDSWTTGTSMPTLRAYPGIGMVGSRIYVFGGTDWSQDFTVNEAGEVPIDTLLQKDVLPAGAACAGGMLTYRIMWANAGVETITGLTITDTLPAGVSYAGGGFTGWAQPDSLGVPTVSADSWATAAAGPWTPGEPADGTPVPLLLRWTVSRIAPAHSGALAFAVTSATWLADGTVLMNRASATAYQSSSVFASSQPSTVIQRASLAAGMTTSPQTPVVTRQVQVVLTVTNTGSVSVPSVAPVIAINAGAPLVALSSGPVPASAAIAPGARQSFTWIYTVSGVGTIRWTATASGPDACGLAVAAAASASSMTTSVDGALAATPNPAPQGTTFTVAFTVTNFGAASASGATAVLGISSGGGSVAYVSGPVPAGPVGIAPASPQTWIWTYSATGACGVVVFSATATATDTGSGLPVSARGSVNVTLPGDAWDPGDDTGPGGTLLVTTTTYQTHGPHALCAADLEDWYRIPMLAGAVYNLTTAGAGSAGDDVGNLYSNSAGTIQVASGDDEGGSAQFSITYTGAANQDYYLRVRHFTPGSPWNGSVRYRSVPASLQAAWSAAPAQAVAGRWVQIVLTVSNSGGMATAVTPVLEVNSGGTQLTYIAGPVPASGSIAYGGMTSFTWTYSVNGGGLIRITATATGSDLASGMVVAAAGSGSVFTTSLAASLTVAPPAVSPGQPVSLALTVTNTGLADVSGVTPAVQVNAGAGLVTLLSGPVPPGPVTLAPGAAQTFAWTWSATAGGAVSFTATASGLDTGSGFSVTGAATRPLTVAIGLAEAVDNLALAWTTGGSTTWYAQTAIFIFGGDAAQSGDILDSQNNWLETTVTGPGTVTFYWKVDSESSYDYLTFLIDGVAQSGAISGNVNWTFKTYPVAGGVHALRWRYSKDGSISTGADAGWVDQVVWAPLILSSSLAVTPASPAVGQWAQIVLTVTNGGAANVTGITPAIQVNAGAGLVAFQSGPVPSGPLTLVPGGAQSFTWTYSASGAGSVNLTATATGIDSGTGNPTVAASTRVFTVLAPASLRAALAIAPLNASAGEWITVRLTVTNAGGVSANGVLPALDLNAGGALLSAVAGPVPPGPVTLAGGAAQTFVWTWSVTAGGPVAFTATATGADAISGAPLSATAYRTGPVTSLRVAVAATPPVAAPGFPVEIAVTVTVTGVATVTGLTPALQFNAGGANLSYVSGPVPASAASLASGGSQTFVWTYNVTSAGAVTLTATVSGADSLGAAAVSAAASRLTQVRRVLLYGPNNDGNMQLAPGIGVTICSEATWRTLTVADFAQYDAIAIGESPLGSSTIGWTALWLTRTTWGAAVTGNIFVYAGDPLSHGKTLVGQQAVLYACDDALAGPGLVVALRAVYEGASAQPVPMLSYFGPFVAGADGCPSIVRVNGTHPQLAPLTDAYLAYGCASHGSFDSWPGEFNPFAIGTNGTLGSYVAPDGTVGRVFMLRRDGTTNPPMLRKTATLRTTPAGTITYALDWTNLTAATHTNVTLTDTLPAGTRWAAGSVNLWAQSDDAGTPAIIASAWATSAAGPWTAGEPADGASPPLVLRWVVNRVAPGRSGILRFTVGAGGLSPGGLVVNRASATVWANAQAAVSQLATTYVDGSLAVHKSAWPAGPVNAGGWLVYTVSWSNPGAGTLVNLTITDTLPNGTAWAAGAFGFFAQADGFGTPILSASAWSAATAGPWIAGEPPDGTASPAVVRWTVDRVAPGRSGSISFGVTVSATLSMGATIANRAAATVWSDGFVYATEEPVRSVTFPVGMAGALAVTPNPAVTGDTVQVALTTTNTGVTTVSGIVPALQINFGGAGLLLLGGPVPPSVASLPVGNAVTFVWTFSVTGGGAVSFTGTVTGTNGAGATGAAATAVLVAASGSCGAPPDLISTVAGTFSSGFNGDFQPATSAWLSNPLGTAVDAAGNLFILDAGNLRVRRVDALTGQITTVAGDGNWGYNGDGIPATSAWLADPMGIAVDPAGHLYIADRSNQRIRRVDAGTGMISTVAGDGNWGYNGDALPAVFAWLADPSGVAVDAAGNLYIADRGNQRIRRVDAGSGLISTLAGDGGWGFNGDGIPAVTAWLADPYGVAVAAAGHVYIADTGNHRIRRVDAGSGIIQTVAGDFSSGYNGDGIPAISAWINWPTGVAVDASDNVYLADNNNSRIRRVAAASGLIATVAGTGINGFSGDGGPGASAQVAWPFGVSVDSLCRVYVADSSNARIRRLQPSPPPPDLTAGLAFTPSPAVVGGSVQVRLTTTNTGATTVNGLAPALQVNAGGGNVALVSGPVPPSVASLPAGNAVTFVWTFSVTGGGAVSFTGTVTGTNGSGPVGATATRVLAVPSGSCVAIPVTISTLAGTSSGGYNGDGIPAATAWLNNPLQTAVDPAGHVYIADASNHRIRRVDGGTGIITTVAGTGTAGYNADGIAATTAWLASPSGVALDAAGNLYIADRGNERIRRVDAGTGMISTVAGTGTAGYNGEGIPATTAMINEPYGITVDLAGNLFLAEQANQRVRRVDAATGQITTVAGTGIWGYSGDGVPATAAGLSDPIGVAFDSGGNMYIADVSANRIRRVDAGSGLISTVAGTGAPGYNGDGIPAVTAWLTFPTAVAVDASDHLYISDTNNQRIRRVDAGTGEITTVAGTGTAAFGGDGGPGTLADVNGPWSVAVDAACRVYVSDSGNDRVRRLDPPVVACPPVSYTLGLQRTPAAPGIGEAVTFLLSLANTGAATITSVRISDTLAAALVNVTVAGPAPFSITESPVGGTVYFWNVSPALITPGATVTLTITGRAALVCLPTMIGNTVWLSASGDCGAPVESSVAAAPFTVAPAVAAITVTTWMTPASPVATGPVAYTIVVSNIGTATIASLTVTDSLSSRITGMTAVPGPAPFGPPVIAGLAGGGTHFEWSASGLAFQPGQTMTFTITGTVGVAATPATVGSTAFAAAGPACGAVSAARPGEAFFLAQTVALGATLDAQPLTVSTGQSFLVTMDTTNAGAGTGTSASATIWRDPASTGGVAFSGVSSPAVASIPPGGRVIFTWTVTALSAGTVMFTGTAYTDEDARGLVSSPAVTIQSAANLVAAAPAVNPTATCSGRSFEVYLPVSNTGQAAATGVTATLWQSSGPAAAVAWGAPFPAVATIAGGGMQVFTWTVTGIAAGMVTLTATATGLDANSGAIPNTSAVTTPVVTISDPAVLAVALSGPGAANIGSPVTIFLTVTNSGGSTASGVSVSATTTAGSGLFGSPAPVSAPVAPAGQQVYAVSYTPLTAGVHDFSVTATGSTCSAAVFAAGTGSLAATTPAALSGTLIVTTPASGFVNVGGLVVVTLTVTNTGGTAANGVGPTPLTPVGAPGMLAGPAQLTGGANLAGGASSSWFWTFTATGAGTLFFNGSAAGTDANTAAAVATPSLATAGLVMVQTPAALSVAAFTANASATCLGEAYSVYLRVANPGGAGAVAVSPTLWISSGPVAGLPGPTPATASIAGGQDVVFTWTLTAPAIGTVGYTATVSGLDANTGAGVTAGPAAGPGVTVAAPATLAAAVSGPAAANPGQLVNLTLTVTNTGGTTAAGAGVLAAADLGLLAGSGTFGAVTPAPSPLAAGLSATYTVPFTPSAAGAVLFSITASGASCGGTAVANATAGLTVTTPAALAASLSVPPGPVCPAAPWMVTMTITNTGQAGATGVRPATPVGSGAGAASFSPPVPAAPVALAGGAAVTFSWTATGTLFGVVTLTASATGDDANDGAPLAVTGVAAPALMIEPPPSVAVSLNRAPAAPQPGGAVTWTWIVTNTSGATLTAIELVDTLPAGFSFASETSQPPLGHAVAGAVHTWAGPVTLAPGATATVSLGASAPCAAVSVTVTGYARGTASCGTAANAPAPDSFATPAPGSLAAAASGPLTVSVGQPFAVRLTVTNTGGADVTGNIPAAAVTPGGLLAGPGAGAPAGPLTLGPGAGQTYVWTATAAGAGTVTFSLSTSGLACGGTSPVTVGASRAVIIQNPAVLVGALSVDPGPVAAGGIIAVRLTVTNTGGADAPGVSPVLPTWFGTGTASFTAGPNPSAPVLLGAGAAITFTWTFTASSPGTVSFSSTATGLDGNAGWAVTTGPLTSGALTITGPPALTGWLTFSRTTASSGQDVGVTLSVSNSGTTAAPVVSAALWQSGGAGSGGVTGPTPASTASLSAGSTVTFSWTLTAGAAGPVNLTATATSSWPATSPAAAGLVLVQTPAALAAAVAAEPASVCVGQPVRITVTVTNTGQATATGVISLQPTGIGTGGATYLDGPFPAAPVDIGGGASISFSWTLTASSSGSLTFSSTASGSDANTGSPVSGVAASAPVAIGDPGTVAAAVGAPAAASTGQWITVTVTATLTGGATVSGLTPVLSFPAAQAALMSGPLPAIASLSGAGTDVTFSWTLSVSGAGPLACSVTVTGSTCGAPAAPLAVAGALTAAVNRAALSAAAALSATTLAPGQAVLLTLTVTNTANAPGAAAAGVTPSLLLGGPAVVVAGPVPATLGALGAGSAQTFVWTVSATGAGAITLTPSVAATDQHGGWPVAAAASAPPAAAYVPGSVVVDGFTLTPGPNVRFTATLTATLTLRNPGQSPVQVTLGALTESGPGPWLLTGPAGYPGAPFTLAAGQSLAVPWTHLANGNCGFTGLSVTVTAAEADFGVPVPDAYGVTAILGIAGVPASLSAVAQPAKVAIRGTTAVIVTVTDACGVPVPGATVDLSLVAPPPGALLSPATAVTDASGRVQGAMTVGAQPGAHRARADAAGAPSVTILVEATAPDDPAAFLSQNFFNPARGERLRIRVLLPAPTPVAIRVYNLAGEPVRKIAEGETGAGLTVFEWDGRNQSGEPAANGVYFIQTVSGHYRDVRRVIILRQ